MFRNHIITFKSFPVADTQRQRTDSYCTICSAIFALTLFILSFLLYHRDYHMKTQYPIDDSGTTCQYEQPQAPLLYFVNLNDLSKDRFCVKSCPGRGQHLQCSHSNVGKCAGVGTSSYDSQEIKNERGRFCVPKNQEMQNKIWESPSVWPKDELGLYLDVLTLNFYLGIFMGIVYLFVSMLIPKLVTYIAFIGGSIVLTFCGILILARPVSIIHIRGWDIALGVGLIVFGVCLVAYLMYYRRQLQLNAIFLTHSRQFLKQVPIVLGYLPLYLFFILGFLCLISWQYIAFASQYPPYFQNGNVFRSYSHNIWMQFFNAVQFIWGIQFLRDSFNYVISGNSMQWYFHRHQFRDSPKCCPPFTRMICKNWGSIVGGSFINAFFHFLHIFSDILRCQSVGPFSKCSTCYKVCCRCQSFLQLTRNDAYTYINMSGLTYCESASQCEVLCQYSDIYRGSQSCMRLYLIASHVFTVSLATVIGFLIIDGHKEHWNMLRIGVMLVAAYSMTVFMVDILANGATGLMVCYLAEQNMDNELMETCPPQIEADMQVYRSLNQNFRHNHDSSMY